LDLTGLQQLRLIDFSPPLSSPLSLDSNSDHITPSNVSISDSNVSISSPASSSPLSLGKDNDANNVPMTLTRVIVRDCDRFVQQLVRQTIPPNISLIGFGLFTSVRRPTTTTGRRAVTTLNRPMTPQSPSPSPSSAPGGGSRRSTSNSGSGMSSPSIPIRTSISSHSVNRRDPNINSHANSRLHMPSSSTTNVGSPTSPSTLQASLTLSSSEGGSTRRSLARAFSALQSAESVDHTTTTTTTSTSATPIDDTVSSSVGQWEISRGLDDDASPSTPRLGPTPESSTTASISRPASGTGDARRVLHFADDTKLDNDDADITHSTDSKQERHPSDPSHTHTHIHGHDDHSSIAADLFVLEKRIEDLQARLTADTLATAAAAAAVVVTAAPSGTTSSSASSPSLSSSTTSIVVLSAAMRYGLRRQLDIQRAQLARARRRRLSAPSIVIPVVPL
jgi:hypothetical protein